MRYLRTNCHSESYLRSAWLLSSSMIWLRGKTTMWIISKLNLRHAVVITISWNRLNGGFLHWYDFISTALRASIMWSWTSFNRGCVHLTTLDGTPIIHGLIPVIVARWTSDVTGRTARSHRRPRSLRYPNYCQDYHDSFLSSHDP